MASKKLKLFCDNSAVGLSEIFNVFGIIVFFFFVENSIEKEPTTVAIPTRFNPT